jgi:DHA1 family bicyclomycin/chloramphenicol resistance-like MFS transporter
MYLPGFAGIAKDLNTTVANVAMTLSSYFIGISAGQLLYGPLLDRYGRKTTVYWFVGLYISFSVFCKGYRYFIVLRFIQAIGSCHSGISLYGS